MSQINTREICLLASQALTTSGTGPDIVVPMGWQAAMVSLTASTITGTSPTYNFFVQKKLRQVAATDIVGTDCSAAGIYDDTLAFSQVTSTAVVRLSSLCTGPQSPTANSSVITTADWLQADATLTAGDIRVGPIGGTWRIKWVVGGTSPSGTFAVAVQLIPWST